MLDIKDYKGKKIYIKADTYGDFKIFAINYMSQICNSWREWAEFNDSFQLFQSWESSEHYFDCFNDMVTGDLRPGFIVYNVRDFYNPFQHTLIEIKKEIGLKVDS
jgi:hypothetical protein